MLDTTTISHLIKSEDLNHHGTLFAGRMAEWLVEASFIAAARLVRRPEDVVCVQIHGMSFDRAAAKGDLIELRADVAYLGTKSITVHAAVYVNEQAEPSVSGLSTFVTVDRDGKPYAHGLALPDEYVERHRAIHDRARQVRAGG
ncbi:MAG: acyl-CoA thioesterase [Candidatus Edwardsbacteria bacterium]|jgi:acyl-CoA hydrolase|nr:acyl-CoA thioesterase [Candidatus Edwardsbacteria bacterium]